MLWTVVCKLFMPFGGEREGSIRAVPGANLGEGPIAPVDDRSEHRINLPLELGQPAVSRLGRRVEPSLEIERRVKRRVLARVHPRLADEHGPKPSVLQGEPTKDVDQALVSQLGPVVTVS